MSNIFFIIDLKMMQLIFRSPKYFYKFLYSLIGNIWLLSKLAVEFLNDCKNGAHVSYEHDVL